jgi:hypothetical protein
MDIVHPKTERTPTTFKCDRWPRCNCPDGTVDIDGPGLLQSTSKIAGSNDLGDNPSPLPRILVCDRWPLCGCASDKMKASCSNQETLSSNYLEMAFWAILGTASITFTALAAYRLLAITGAVQ